MEPNASGGPFQHDPISFGSSNLADKADPTSRSPEVSPFADTGSPEFQRSLSCRRGDHSDGSGTRAEIPVQNLRPWPWEGL